MSRPPLLVEVLLENFRQIILKISQAKAIPASSSNPSTGHGPVNMINIQKRRVLKFLINLQKNLNFILDLGLKFLCSSGI